VNHWWRAYNEAVNDPKLQLLSDSLFRAWFNVMCIASANGGSLPALKDIAFTLRIQPTKAAQVLAQLHAAGLLDKTETGFIPHNWNGRQYKSDVSTDRVKQFRKRQRNVSSGVSETPPETETDTDDRIGPRASAFTPGSKALVASLWKALGVESPLHVTPELAGADWRAIEWERAGWTGDLIEAECRRIGPGKPLVYYEKVFATAFAKRQAPLPNVEIRQAETLTVTHGKPKAGIIQAADNLIAKLASFDGPPRRVDELRSGAGEAPVRMLPNG
jgi:hypothetical protein